MLLLLLPDYQTTQLNLSRDRSSVKSNISFELVRQFNIFLLYAFWYVMLGDIY